MASSVSSSTSLLPKKRKLSTSSSLPPQPPETTTTTNDVGERHLNMTESLIEDSFMSCAVVEHTTTAPRKASHDSSHGGSAATEDADALATLPSLGSFGSNTSKGFIRLPQLPESLSEGQQVPQQQQQQIHPSPRISQQQRCNLPKKRKIAADDVSDSLTPKEVASLDQRSVATTKTSASGTPTSNRPVVNVSAVPTPTNAVATTSALEHLDALGDETAFIDTTTATVPGLGKPDSSNLKEPPQATPTTHHQQQPHGLLLPPFNIGDENSSGTTLGSSNQRILLEALKMTTSNNANSLHHAVGYGRDRLESWGGMSDLSVTGMGSDLGAAALAASALHHTGLLDDIHAATAAACGDSVTSSVSEEKPSAIPSRISLGRDRKFSVASLSEVSASGVPFLSDVGDVSTDVHVAAATLADQLSELAGAVEAAASSADSVTYQLMREAGIASDASSVASPLIGAMNDSSSMSGLDPSYRQRSRSSTVVSFSQQLAVDIDFDAVAAAVDAAEAVTCALDLTAIASSIPTADNKATNKKAASSKSDSKHSRNKTSKRHTRRPLPLNKKRSNTIESLGSFPSDLTFSATASVPIIPPMDRDLDAIRERARAAAGYVPPSATSAQQQPEGACTPPPRAPFKKRAKRQSPEPDVASSTPKLSNTSTNRIAVAAAAAAAAAEIDEDLEDAVAAAAAAAADAKGPANLKWEEMFQTLLAFIEERRDEETKTLSDVDKVNWVWDGNVPTNFKTGDGKALGRWINNQRSAKSKGVLKLDRENRLVSTGLKWSVLTSNSWNKMLEELRIYAEEQQSKNGEPWDGNVPTNYVLPKGRATEFDEDKNLGRWVNRQRCLLQSGKLKKERKEALDKMGLKWSMLATTTWDEMFESLREYAKAKSQDSQVWDGNVPANYKTADKPPRSLGRWINRQRSAYTKNKLKQEHVTKLSGLGLKWAIHERKQLAVVPATVSPTSNGVPDAAAVKSDIPDKVKSESNAKPTTKEDQKEKEAIKEAPPPA